MEEYKMANLLEIAEAQIAEKQAKEIEEVKERIKKDKEVIARAIQLVKDHTLYKKVTSDYGWSYSYVLVTEEMLKEDYLKNPVSFSRRGIYFYDKDEKYRKYNTGILKVNGETYYDIRYALEDYERELVEKKNRVESLVEDIRNIENDIKGMNKLFPSLKKSIEEWQEYQSKMSIEEYENEKDI